MTININLLIYVVVHYLMKNIQMIRSVYINQTLQEE